jgi:hypothetical protein
MTDTKINSADWNSDKSYNYQLMAESCFALDCWKLEQ